MARRILQLRLCFFEICEIRYVNRFMCKKNKEIHFVCLIETKKRLL